MADGDRIVRQDATVFVPPLIVTPGSPNSRIVTAARVQTTTHTVRLHDVLLENARRWRRAVRTGPPL